MDPRKTSNYRKRTSRHAAAVPPPGPDDGVIDQNVGGKRSCDFSVWSR